MIKQSKEYTVILRKKLIKFLCKSSTQFQYFFNNKEIYTKPLLNMALYQFYLKSFELFPKKLLRFDKSSLTYISLRYLIQPSRLMVLYFFIYFAMKVYQAVCVFKSVPIFTKGRRYSRKSYDCLLIKLRIRKMVFTKPLEDIHS